MPYRRLPNTDTARIRALNAALQKGEKMIPFNLAFSQKTLQEIKYFLPSFKQAIQLHKEAYNKQVEGNKKYLEHQKKAKIYISHFIQVLNLGIARNEHSEDIRKYYNLTDYDHRVPPLNNEKEIFEWGNSIIKGEAERIAKGLSPVTNPTGAMVKVMFERFNSAFQKQSAIKDKSQHTLDRVVELRNKADELIVNLWNEIENTFEKLPQDLKREKASEYGIVYVFRKNELPSFMNVNSQVS
jgi:hypothetical protein